MAENYEVGRTYYLPVRVYDVMDSTYTYPVRFEFENGSGCMDGKNALKSDPGLLFTAYEVYLCNVTALKEEIATLKSENERLSKQNEELGTKVDELEAELNNAKALNEFAVKTEQNREKLIAEQRELMKKYSVVIDVLIDKIVALRNGENNG